MEIKIISTYETTYEDNTSWIHYEVETNRGLMYGYAIVPNQILNDNHKIIQQIQSSLDNKVYFDDLGEKAQPIIKELENTANEMFYLTSEDIEYYFDVETIEQIEKVFNEIKDECIVFENNSTIEYLEFTKDAVSNNEDLVTVFGGALTQVHFHVDY